jgi:hypothetical protein
VRSPRSCNTTSRHWEPICSTESTTGQTSSLWLLAALEVSSRSVDICYQLRIAGVKPFRSEEFRARYVTCVCTTRKGIYRLRRLYRP